MNLLENTQVFKKLIDTSFLKISKETNLTVNEIRVLLFLYQNEKLDIASDIVEKLMISKSHISFSVESLKNKGYIEKVLDTQNKKKLHLKLTNKAEKIVNLLDNEQNKLKDTLLQNIDEQEKKQFKDTFEKILKNAKNMAK
jgi:DNA-binding MarR family transcriptional regulator